MSPPKQHDHEAAGPSPFAAAASYNGRCRRLAELAGVVNAAHGAMVDVAVEALDERDHVGPGLHSPGQFLAWRTGCSIPTANHLVAIARRRDELPLLVAALRAGEISLEQAAVVARCVPAAYDASATDLARTSTVEQLTSVLPGFRCDDESPEEAAERERRARARRERSSGLFHDDDGGARLSVHLDPAQAAAVQAALDAAREDLFRERREDAAAASEDEASGGEPKVPAPTLAEAAAALAASALEHGAAARPGSERHLVTYHLGAAPDGSPCLTDERGRIVPGPERRRLLCDHRFELLLHGGDGRPLGVGRATRNVRRKLRRAVLHRHRGRCAVPGCEARRGLEIHHVVHWEDGGPTDPDNLIPLCHRHHKDHHDGLLAIEGDPELVPGTAGCLTFGLFGVRLDATGTPVPVSGSIHAAATERIGHSPPFASTPSGERLHRPTFDLRPAPEPAASVAAGAGALDQSQPGGSSVARS